MPIKNSEYNIQENITVNRQTLNEINTSGNYTWLDDNADQEAPEITQDDYENADIESPVEADEESDDDYEIENDSDYAGNKFSVKPIWILINGQIIWAASRYGFRLGPKEYLRRRIQLLLNFLAEEFPEKSYEDLLLSLQGFFVRDNDADTESSSWMNSLKTTGILYGEDNLLKDKIIPLSKFRVGQGKGKDTAQQLTRLPDTLEYLWLEHQLLKPERASQLNPLAWKNCKDWLIDGLNEFCRKINDFCFTFNNENDTEENAHGIGLKHIEFGYRESTIQRKRLEQWKKWWSQR